MRVLDSSQTQAELHGGHLHRQPTFSWCSSKLGWKKPCQGQPQLLSLPCISPGDGAQAYETICMADPFHSLRAGGSLAKALVNTNHIVGLVPPPSSSKVIQSTLHRIVVR